MTPPINSFREPRNTLNKKLLSNPNVGNQSSGMTKSGSKKTSQHALGCAVDFEINGVANIKVAYWLVNNVDFDQCILEYYKPDDGQAGWIHVSYNEKGENRKQILTFDGKKYTNGFPDMKWQDGKVIE